MLIQCKLGPAEVPVAGRTYQFELDQYERAVANVDDERHVACFLAVEHYVAVPEQPAAIDDEPQADDPPQVDEPDVPPVKPRGKGKGAQTPVDTPPVPEPVIAPEPPVPAMPVEPETQPVAPEAAQPGLGITAE